MTLKFLSDVFQASKSFPDNIKAFLILNRFDPKLLVNTRMMPKGGHVPYVSLEDIRKIKIEPHFC